MYGIYGFTVQGTSTVYIAPDQCDALHTTLDNQPWGYYDTGMSYLALALLALIHESEHQAGHWDEAGAECAALPLVSSMAVKYFGVPATYTVAKAKTVWKKVGKKRVRTQKIVQVEVVNPDVVRIQQWATVWHDTLPPEYRTSC